MGQMVMIDEDKLETLEIKAVYCDRYCRYIDEIEKCYPDVSYWLDTGTGYQCNIEVLGRALMDLKKYRKRKIRKYEKDFWKHVWDD